MRAFEDRPLGDAGVISIPVPLVTAGLAAWAGLQIALRQGGPRASRRLFAAFFGLVALQALLVTLRLGYGIEAIRPIQPLLPFAAGPLLFLGFRALSVERIAPEMRLHLGLSGLVAATLLLLPPARAALDPAIGLSYATYALLLLRHYRQGPDGLARAPAGDVPRLRRWQVAAIALLAFLCAVDALIAFDFWLGGGNLTRIVSGASLLLIATALALWAREQARPKVERPATTAAQGLAEKARHLLRETGLYADPELTLTRLARRLGVPDRALSAAINDACGTNVSQFINDFRVAAAARLLLESDESVSAITLKAGFHARSNFYREFRRVHGLSPGDYRKGALNSARTPP